MGLNLSIETVRSDMSTTSIISASHPKEARGHTVARISVISVI